MVKIRLWSQPSVHTRPPDEYTKQRLVAPVCWLQVSAQGLLQGSLGIPVVWASTALVNKQPVLLPAVHTHLCSPGCQLEVSCYNFSCLTFLKRNEMEIQEFPPILHPSVKNRGKLVAPTSDAVILLTAWHHSFWDHSLLGSRHYQLHFLLALSFPTYSWQDSAEGSASRHGG